MHYRFLALFAVAIAAMGFSEPQAPDDPSAKAPIARYAPVMAGTKSFLPVEPMPWGEVNRRVTPKPPRKPDQK
jgi:hypothetical protein